MSTFFVEKGVLKKYIGRVEIADNLPDMEEFPMSKELIELLLEASDILEHHVGSSYCDSCDDSEEDLIRRIRECPEITQYQAAVEQHNRLQRAIREGRYCADCSREFPTPSALRQHMQYSERHAPKKPTPGLDQPFGDCTYPFSR